MDTTWDKIRNWLAIVVPILGGGLVIGYYLTDRLARLDGHNLIVDYRLMQMDGKIETIINEVRAGRREDRAENREKKDQLTN